MGWDRNREHIVVVKPWEVHQREKRDESEAIKLIGFLILLIVISLVLWVGIGLNMFISTAISFVITVFLLIRWLKRKGRRRRSR